MDTRIQTSRQKMCPIQRALKSGRKRAAFQCFRKTAAVIVGCWCSYLFRVGFQGFLIYFITEKESRMTSKCLFNHQNVHEILEMEKSIKRQERQRIKLSVLSTGNLHFVTTGIVQGNGVGFEIGIWKSVLYGFLKS